MSSGALTLELRLAPCSEQRLSRVGLHHGRAWGDDLGHVPRRPIRRTRVYAALGDSISIDEYAGGSGLGGASLFARNRDDTFPRWRGRDLTTVHPRVSAKSSGDRVGGQWSSVFAGVVAESGGDVRAAIVAESGQAWDAVLLVSYPNRRAFSDMVRDPAYQTGTHLRTEALTEAVLQPTIAAPPFSEAG